MVIDILVFLKMNTLLSLILGCLITQTLGDDPPINDKPFSEDFMFGTATSAYQIEGAWDTDGKGENVWDRYTHQIPSPIANGSNGNIACDSYHKYKDDVLLLVDLGVQHYRFSLSWSRILPGGLINNVNTAGVSYYKNLIKELKQNHIEPLVTLFHWDTPQALEDMGGWPNPQIINWFSDYARLCFDLFGDDVKYWMTFNEPKQTCNLGYGIGMFAPGIKSPGEAEYLCIHNVVRSHAEVWHIYNDEYRAKQQGKVGIVIDSNWFEPEDATLKEDQDASETLLEFTHGIFANPVFFGDYPSIVKDNIKRRSHDQGFKSSRLPEFTAHESTRLAGTVDFLGVNTYTTSLVRPVKEPNKDGKGLDFDSEVEQYQPENWEGSASSWLKVVPSGAGKLVKWITKKYNNPLMLITENGYSDPGTLDDQKRIDYVQKYLSSIKDAVEETQANLFGYTLWSLMDNFEWLDGYTSHFGLYQVDFQDANRKRTPKKSVEYYKKLIKTRCLVDKCK